MSSPETASSSVPSPSEAKPFRSDDDEPPHGMERSRGHTWLLLEVYRPATGAASNWDVTLGGADFFPHIVDFESGGLCARAGVKRGDVLCAVNGIAVFGHQEGIAALDAARGDVELTIKRPADEPLNSIGFCCCCCTVFFLVCLLLGFGAVEHSSGGSVDEVTGANGPFWARVWRPPRSLDSARTRVSSSLRLPRPRYGGPYFEWRSRCRRAHTKFSIASWPNAAENATRRWDVLVRADSEVVGVGLPVRWDNSTRICMLSSRTGVAMDNLLISPRVERPAASPNQTARAKILSGVIFEPAAGPGVYQLYEPCNDPFRAPVDPAWRAAAMSASGPTGSASSGSASVLPGRVPFWRSATVLRKVTRASVLQGVAWHFDTPNRATRPNKRAASGNVRAIATVPFEPAEHIAARRPARQLAEIPAASAGESGRGGRGGRSVSSPRVVRVFVRWRRPPGSALSYGPPPMAFRVACGREVPVTIIDGDEDELELLLYPQYGGGRHVIYLLPFDRRKDPYDAQFEQPRPTNPFSASPAHTLGQFLNRIEVRSAAWTNT